MKDIINNALIALVLDTLLDMEDMEDINNVECYEFNIYVKHGKVFRVKGVVKVEIDDIEEVE